jgi:hypothetical protein
MAGLLVTGGLLDNTIVTEGLAESGSAPPPTGYGTSLNISGLSWFALVTGGLFTLSTPVIGQLFEQALVAKLRSLTALTSIIGSALFKTGIPQTEQWDFGVNGPALTYSVPTKPYGHVLTGSDGTATARVQIDMWGYNEGEVKTAIEIIRQNIDGSGLGQTWGNGSVIIMGCIQQDDTDADEPPKAGSDQWLYHSLTEYSIKYRLSLPVPV